MPVYSKFLGKACGNFRLGKVSREDIIKSISSAKDGGNFPEKFFIPRCDFTNNIISEDSEFDKWDDNFLMSKELADGVILKNPYHAALIFNADCLAICVYDISSKRLGVLHGGYKCLVRDSYDKNILEVLFSKHKFNPNSVFVNLGYGIGACCYGRDFQREFSDSRLYGRHYTQFATKGPREGQTSVNLGDIAVEILKKIGVPESRVESESICTACAGRNSLNDKGDYHSHAWDGADAGRNAFFAWYSKL